MNCETGIRLRLCVAMCAQLIGSGVVGHVTAGEESPWRVVKAKHFLVCHANDEALAHRVAERAEGYYDAIAADLGYTRYQGFWLWENRARIVIYPTAAAFAEACNAPTWAMGRASARRREIAGYSQDGETFVRDVLPHEMAHLVLDAFVGEGRVPLWLGEGFAQWETPDKRKALRGGGAADTKRIPFKTWIGLDIRHEKDHRLVSAYYAQSASVIGFLIETQGGTRFGQLCRALRDGKTPEAALAEVYPGVAANLARLEESWDQWRKETQR